MKKSQWQVAGALMLAWTVTPSSVHAQNDSPSTWLTTLELGTGVRVGAVPGGYTAAGNNWDGYLVVGRKLHRDVWLAASAGMAMQEFAVATSADSSFGAPYAFHSYVLAVGPTFVTKPWDGFLAIASVQPAMVVSFWSLGSYNDCTISCVGNTSQPRSHQTELRPAATFNLMMAYQLVGPNNGQRPWALGIQLRGLAAPAHRGSGIPLSQVGFSLGFIAGAP